MKARNILAIGAAAGLAALAGGCSGMIRVIHSNGVEILNSRTGTGFYNPPSRMWDNNVETFCVHYLNEDLEKVTICSTNVPPDYSTAPQISGIWLNGERQDISTSEETLRDQIIETAQQRWLEKCKEVECIEAYRQYAADGLLNRL